MNPIATTKTLIETTKKKSPIDTPDDTNPSALKKPRQDQASTAVVALNALSEPLQNLQLNPLSETRTQLVVGVMDSLAIGEGEILATIFSYLPFKEIINLRNQMPINFSESVSKNFDFCGTNAHVLLRGILEKPKTLSNTSSSTMSLQVDNFDENVPFVIRSQLEGCTIITLQEIDEYIKDTGIKLETIFSLMAGNLKVLDFSEISIVFPEDIISKSKKGEALTEDYWMNEKKRIDHIKSTIARCVSLIEDSLIHAGKYCHLIEKILLPFDQISDQESIDKFHNAFLKSAPSWKKMQHLQLYPMDSNKLFEVLKQMPLTTLGLRYSRDFTSEVLAKMMESCPNLTALESQEISATDGNEDIALEEEINKWLISVGEKCLKLQKFKFSPRGYNIGGHRLNEHNEIQNGILSMFKGCRDLKSFELDATDINQEIIDAIWKHLPLIEHLAFDLMDSSLTLSKLFSVCQNLKSFTGSAPIWTDRIIDEFIHLVRCPTTQLEILDVEIGLFTINEDDAEHRGVTNDKLREFIECASKSTLKSFTIRFLEHQLEHSMLEQTIQTITPYIQANSSSVPAMVFGFENEKGFHSL